MFELFGFDSNKCKGNKKRVLCTMAGFYLAELLGLARPGMAAPQQELRCLNEQGRAERVKRMRENSEEEKVNMASML
jgi:hypothetical protein